MDAESVPNEAEAGKRLTLGDDNIIRLFVVQDLTFSDGEIALCLVDKSQNLPTNLFRISQELGRDVNKIFSLDMDVDMEGFKKFSIASEVLSSAELEDDSIVLVIETVD